LQGRCAARADWIAGGPSAAAAVKGTAAIQRAEKTTARARQTSVHCEISIRPMTAVGHERRTRFGSGSGACPLRSESDWITASPRMDATCHKRL